MADKFSWEKDVKTKRSAKVGEAVQKILSKDQPAQSVGETLEAMSPKYLEELRSCCFDNAKRYDSPFYIVVLGKKEPFALNVVRHWFIARQTKPSSATLLSDYPNHFHEVYSFNDRSGDCRLIWALTPTWNHDAILRHPDLYHPDLVQWHFDHYRERLQ